MVTHCKPTPIRPRRTGISFSPAPDTLTTEEILQEIHRLRAASRDMYRQLVERANEELAAEEAAC
jgi:hypothetical protein